MMPTALQMITRAMRLSGDYEVGQTLSADDASDALYSLNAMMDSWGNQRLMIYQVLVEEFPLVAGQSEYTIWDDPSADFETARPIALENTCFLRNAQIDYPLELINQAAYALIPDKFVQTMPSFLYYETSYPEARIFFDCKPYAGFVLHLSSRKMLQGPFTLTTQLAMPPGYQDAIEYTLAERLCPEYGHPVPPDVRREATNARRWLKTLNDPQGVLQTEVGIMNTNYVWNIWAG